jgi:O-methyltransferase
MTRTTSTEAKGLRCKFLASSTAFQGGSQVISDVPFLLRVPGLRRYAAQIARLRTQLGEMRRELKALRHVSADQAADRELLAKARHYPYYLVNAEKKIDVRQLPQFGELAQQIRSEGQTYLHFDRLYTLWQAVQTMPSSARAIVEVGVYRGGSARFLAEALRLQQRPDVVLFACDTFAGHTEVDEGIDGAHQPGVQFRRVTARRVAKYLGTREQIRLIQGDIRETASTFAAKQAFGLVHVDVDVFPITRFCLEFFGPRVVPGGAFIVDDYGTLTCRGVQKAVDEFATSNPHFRLLHLLTGQALLVRLF